ncbi:MAG TPA: hypothetical protein VIK63_03090 [Haloplasmataceae bacterium]
MPFKFIRRAIVWGLLITLLTLLTIYLYNVIIKPFDDEITELEQNIKKTEYQLRLLQTQINLYTEENLLDRGAIQERLPRVELTDELERSKYLYTIEESLVKDLVKLSNGRLFDYEIDFVDRSKESSLNHLPLSSHIHAVRVQMIIIFEQEAHLYDYLQVLSQTLPILYIKEISFNLSSELQPQKDYQLNIIFYTFYYTD